jgi:hypothetical protein
MNSTRYRAACEAYPSGFGVDAQRSRVYRTRDRSPANAADRVGDWLCHPVTDQYPAAARTRRATIHNLRRRADPMTFDGNCDVAEVVISTGRAIRAG